MEVGQIGEMNKASQREACEALEDNAGIGLLSHVYIRSIIGDEVLNCRVRNGTGCTHLSMDAGKFLCRIRLDYCNGVALQLQAEAFIQLKGGKRGDEEKVDRPISTDKLSMSPCLHFRPINLVVFQGSSGRSYLKAGFPLRCFQRLSLPNVATLRCFWRNNRDTRGSSIPVLSY